MKIKNISDKITSYFRRAIVTILNKLKRLGISLDGPRAIRINPWSNCNLKCRMCYLPMLSEKELKEANDQKLDHKDYLVLINKLGLETREIEICGAGETLLFPGIEEMMAEVKKKRIFGRLITNGTLLNDDMCQLLVRLRWDSVRISLNAASRDVYLNTMGADFYDGVITNIRRLVAVRGRKTKPRITLHFVIQESNYEEIVEFASLTKNLGTDGFSYRWPHPGVGDFDNIEPNKEQRRKIIALLQKALRGIRDSDFNREAINHYEDEQSGILRHAYLANRYCPFVQDSIEILSDGSVVPCCIISKMPDMLNIKEYPLAYIWRSEKYKKFRNDLLSGRFREYCYKCCPRVLPERKK